MSNSRNREPQYSRREQGQVRDKDDKRAFKLKQGIRNYLVFTLVFCLVSNLFYSTGWWEVQNDQWDQTMRVLGVMFPALGILWIMILEN
jgi:hypothetical protein